jgi:hypothetical protein
MNAQEKLKLALDAIDPKEFNFKDVEFCGEDAVLVNPALQGTNWTQINKYLRSIIYRKSDNKILSSGFPKFCNYGENPDNFPPPDNLLDSRIISKEDGSLMIVDFVNDQLNIRTRGTDSYVVLENSKDFEVALEKYPIIKPWLKNHNYFSLLFEIVTPNQRIVLDYPEIDLFLIGAMDKNTLRLEPQALIDSYSLEMCVPRPNYYHFDNISELIETIKSAIAVEGCCVYKDDGIWKIKSESYLKLHQFKSNATIKNILELYAEQDFPQFKEFKNYILNHFDWECWQMVEKMVEKIDDIKNVIEISIDKVHNFVNRHNDKDDKEFAQAVNNTYSSPWNSVAFCIRKGKVVPVNLIKKMIKERYENG